jgi:hypothetical protein
MATVGWLKIGVTTDTSQFQKGLTQAAKQVDGFKTALLAGGAAIVGAFGAAISTQAFAGWIKGSMNASDAVHDLASRTGLAAEELSKLSYAAKFAGVDQDELVTSIEQMNKRLGQVAIEGAGPAADALKRFGISAKELAIAGPAVAFEKIITLLATIPNAMERAKVATDLFGKSGQAMIQIAAQGPAALKGLGDEATKMGVAISNIDSEKIAEANDALDRVGAAVQGLGNMIAVTLSPYLTYVADQFVDWAKEGSVASQIVASSMQGVVSTLGVVTDAVHLVQSAWFELGSGVLESVGMMLKGIEAMTHRLQFMTDTIAGAAGETSGLRQFFAGMFQGVGTGAVVATKDVEKFAKDWSGAFEDAAAKMVQKGDAAWAQVGKGHQQVADFLKGIQIAAGERAKLAAGKEAAFRAPGAGIAPKMAAEYKTAGAFEAGSVAAYSAIVQAKGQQAGVIQNRIELNTRQAAEGIGKLVNAAGRDQAAAGGGADGEQFRRQHAGV